MKKQLFLMSALALTVLTSCGSQSTSGLKVGLVCLHSEVSTYDNNFIQAFNKAVETSKAKGYVGVSAIKKNIGEDETCQTAEEQFADDGYNIVFTDSFGHDAYTRKVANNYKNVTFSSATGTQALVAGLPNYHNAFASIYEGRYLAGVAAGQYLLENKHTSDEEIKIGYVGALPYAEVISGYTAWYLGVKSVFPKVTMLVNYTGTWYDYDLEKSYAQALLSQGCILISQHADSLGAPDACKEAKIPNVSYNMNTVEQAGDSYKETYVAHSKINWQLYYEKVIEAVATGKAIDGEKDQNWTGTLSDGTVQYEVSDLVKDKTKITEAEKQLKEGTLQVFDVSKFTVKEAAEKCGFTKGKEFDYDEDGHLTKFMGDIRDEGDYARDTDLVEGGKYVKESYYRSAPAFDLIIDGIELFK